MLRTLTAVSTSLVLLCAPARADEVHDALEAYALYQSDVSALLDSDIESARDVDAALARLQRHNMERVSRGWIAYGALTAAQSPAFAEGVEHTMRQSGRAPLLSQLRGDLYFARREPAGSSQAIQLILNAASADSARVAQAGARYDRYARSSTAERAAASSAGPAARETVRLSPTMRDRLRVTPLSARPMREIEDFGGPGFWDSLAGREARAASARSRREHGDYASVTDHMLTLGALVVADATESERRRAAALLDEPLTQHCMNMQRLQLRQCVGVSVDATERAYCLAQHGLVGPGACFSNVVR
jgi:hypothetical protein